MEASDETVIEAAKIAQIHDFIDQLPLKYDSEIGERGTGLSGGQRQRVAIARTLLTGPPVLIFDDSTSSVDAGTDARIRQELGRVAKGRTTIIIAHRLSSLMHAQEILVLDTGRIVERGNHDDLIALGGRYSELWSLQQKQATEIDE
jgi:ATP-binding cassette subfamily B protein